MNRQDLVEELAQEREISERQKQRRRIGYQILIFLISFTLNFFNRLRQQYIMKWQGCQGEKLANATNECNDFKYSVTISAGIGFIFLGNIYDNIEKPRQVTVLLLVILSVISLVEAIFANELEDEKNGTQVDSNTKVALTLYQMSSVFEAGVSLACIVIIHNWFKESVLGTVSAIWFTAVYLQLIFAEKLYDGSNQQSIDNAA